MLLHPPSRAVASVAADAPFVSPKHMAAPHHRPQSQNNADTVGRTDSMTKMNASHVDHAVPLGNECSARPRVSSFSCSTQHFFCVYRFVLSANCATPRLAGRRQRRDTHYRTRTRDVGGAMGWAHGVMKMNAPHVCHAVPWEMNALHVLGRPPTHRALRTTVFGTSIFLVLSTVPPPSRLLLS